MHSITCGHVEAGDTHTWPLAVLNLPFLYVGWSSDLWVFRSVRHCTSALSWAVHLPSWRSHCGGSQQGLTPSASCPCRVSDALHGNEASYDWMYLRW